jgi:ATP-grasp domain
VIVLARPSISPYLSRTLFELQEPALFVEDVQVPMRPALKTIPEKEIRANPKLAYQSLILTASENALSHLYGLIPNDERVLKSRLFKDKVEFRRALSRQFKGFFFRELSPRELRTADLKGFPFPVILKPSVGISSIGVTRVESAKDWKRAVDFLERDFAKYKKNYEANVVEEGKLIVEEYIEGPELAIDGYFNADSQPVILNILEHMFAGPGDTSDLVYYTRKSLVEKYYARLMNFLRSFGDVFDLKRFPFHLEVRVTKKGDIIPIELNPLRFAGLGTTELAEYAWGINVYKDFFLQRSPDWDSILKRDDDSVYSFMCADLPAEAFRAKGLLVRDRELFKEFCEVLDYRILDEQETSTFAVIFYRSEDLKENQRFLKLDFGKYASFQK